MNITSGQDAEEKFNFLLFSEEEYKFLSGGSTVSPDRCTGKSGAPILCFSGWDVAFHQLGPFRKSSAPDQKIHPLFDEVSMRKGNFLEKEEES